TVPSGDTTRNQGRLTRIDGPPSRCIHMTAWRGTGRRDYNDPRERFEDGNARASPRGGGTGARGSGGERHGGPLYGPGRGLCHPRAGVHGPESPERDRLLLLLEHPPAGLARRLPVLRPGDAHWRISAVRAPLVDPGGDAESLTDVAHGSRMSRQAWGDAL